MTDEDQARKPHIVEMPLVQQPRQPRQHHLDPRSKMMPQRLSIRDSTLVVAMLRTVSTSSGGDAEDECIFGVGWSRPVAGDDDEDVVYERIVDVLGREPVPDDKVLTNVLKQIITFEDLSKLGFYDYRHVFPIQMEVHVAAR